MVNKAMAYTLSIAKFARLGKICATRTARACGIVPAVLISLGETLALSEEQVLRG